MRFATGFFARLHRAPDADSAAPMPSGYYSGSGYSPGYVRLKNFIEQQYPGIDVTANFLRDALQVTPRAAGQPPAKDS